MRILEHLSFVHGLSNFVQELFDTIKKRYDSQISPYYAASRLWIDAIIDPADTRKVISMGIEMANHKKAEKQYNVGVIQT